MNWIFGPTEGQSCWYARLSLADGTVAVTVIGFPTWQDASRYPITWTIEQLKSGREEARLVEAQKALLADQREAELLRALAEIHPQGRVS